MEGKKRSSFSGTIGFVIASAASAIGLGNIWRFPYLAAKDGGGLFLVIYIVLALTFGYTMLITEIGIGRNTAQGPLTAYGKIDKHFGFIGILAWIVPALILPYYCVIGGWVLKYVEAFAVGENLKAAEDGYFSAFISGTTAPIVLTVIYLALTAVIVYFGVEKGIEATSKVFMPILLVMVVGIAIFSLTLTHTDADGVTRTSLEGLKIYLIPNLDGITLERFLQVVMDALGQLFYSVSVAMGIMIAYGSYAKKETDLVKSVHQIEFFDSFVAIFAGMMIIPAVYTFMGLDGMSVGPGLIFVSLPKVFKEMGIAGRIMGILFFIIVSFAALSSSVSIMEAIVSSVMDKFRFSRHKATVLVTIYTLIVALIVCLGYNVLYCEITLPNGSVGQILDLLDFISNSFLMPIVALLTCILIGWAAGPKHIIEEVECCGNKFSSEKFYWVMIRIVAPTLLTLLMLQSLGFVAF